jgi:ketosteroid isomerase-like protein
MNRMLATLVTVILVARGVFAVTHEATTDAQVTRSLDDRGVLATLNDDYVRAVLTSDVARFEQILAADFRNTNPDGTIVDRRGFLAQIAKPANLKSLGSHDVEIRILGDTAVIHARTVYETSDGRPGSGRYTDIWRKQDGRWLAVAAHVTRLVR